MLIAWPIRANACAGRGPWPIHVALLYEKRKENKTNTAYVQQQNAGFLCTEYAIKIPPKL